MTEEEIKEQIEQAKQDQITLNYSTWAAEQRRLKLSDSHDLWQQQHAAMLARQRSDNTEARRKYLDGLEGAKAERQKEANALLDQELEPKKQMLKRDWLANNVGKTEGDFDRLAWPLLRENLIEQRKQEAFNAEMQAQASTGRYSL